MHVRKTYDVWEVQGEYGSGWELVTTETTQKEGLERLKEYRINCPEHPHRIIKKRVRMS